MFTDDNEKECCGTCDNFDNGYCNINGFKYPEDGCERWESKRTNAEKEAQRARNAKRCIKL